MTGAFESIDLKRLRDARNLGDSDFLRTYESLMIGQLPAPEDLRFLLSRAALLLRASDPNLNSLGYRVVLQYSELTKDLAPLYEIAVAKDYTPILDAIERIQEPDFVSALASDLIAANRVNYVLGEGKHLTVRTRGQLRLRAFTSSTQFGVVVAPTSYGKSEIMREQIYTALEDTTAILVPTKSLLAQTRNALISDPKIRSSTLRVITHPELYLPNRPFVAVMTQERLFRLFQEQQDLSFHQVLVDEAHNLLGSDRRAEQLSEVLLIAAHRSPSTRILFFSPFLENPSSLQLVGAQRELTSRDAREQVKVERLYFSDLPTGTLKLYDQFLKQSFTLDTDFPQTEREALVRLAGRKNLVYLNRPRHAEEVASELASVLPELAKGRSAEASRAIAEHVHPQYKLIDTLKKGVVFHHGSMPEIVRLYVENAFADVEADSAKYMISTSTLLEGVNTPADTMFVLNPDKGPRRLSASQFRNLVGRVGRFKEIFGSDQPRLNLLQPKVYVLKGEHAPAAYNIETFLGEVADVRVDASEEPSNPLLVAAEGGDRREDLLERLDNLEPGLAASQQLDSLRRLETRVGLLALAHGANEYDLFEYESELDRRVKDNLPAQTKISSSEELVDAVVGIFLRDMPLDEKNARNLIRLANQEKARAFYAMFLDWRARGMSLREMVAREIKYFKDQGSAKVFVGSTWGDETFDEGWRKLWAIPSKKSDAELATLAVAKVKEEQDFIDFYLMRYVEVLFDLGFLDLSFYYQIKYGTDDGKLILCLQQGFSIELAKLILESYADFVEVDTVGRTIAVRDGLAEAMKAAQENDILIFEAERLA